MIPKPASSEASLGLPSSTGLFGAAMPGNAMMLSGIADSSGACCGTLLAGTVVLFSWLTDGLATGVEVSALLVFSTAFIVFIMFVSGRNPTVSP